MTVTELIHLLGSFPADTEVLVDLRSDYSVLSATGVSVVRAIDKPNDGYVMRAHPTARMAHLAKDYVLLSA